MIAIPSNVRVWLAAGHTDMRRGMQGLALQVQEGLHRDPHVGDLFVFRGKRGNLVKIKISKQHIAVRTKETAREVLNKRDDGRIGGLHDVGPHFGHGGHQPLSDDLLRDRVDDRVLSRIPCQGDGVSQRAAIRNRRTLTDKRWSWLFALDPVPTASGRSSVRAVRPWPPYPSHKLLVNSHQNSVRIGLIT